MADHGFASNAKLFEFRGKEKFVGKVSAGGHPNPMPAGDYLSASPGWPANLRCGCIGPTESMSSRTSKDNLPPKLASFIPSEAYQFLTAQIAGE